MRTLIILAVSLLCVAAPITAFLWAACAVSHEPADPKDDEPS